MSTERKQINFTIVPDEEGAPERSYANFCGIAHTPFDFTLTFCEVTPLSEKEIREAEADQKVHSRIKARVVMPVQSLPMLIGALQENLRMYYEAHPQQEPPPPRGHDPIH